jgi:hypothetical protein
MIDPDDLMTHDEFDRLSAEHGPNYAYWEGYARWLKAWRAENPDDDRDDLELIDEFSRWSKTVNPPSIIDS